MVRYIRIGKYWVGMIKYIKYIYMKETKKKQYNFLHPDGSEWFDFNEVIKRYEDHLIRIELGGNKGIHKIKEYGNVKHA
jgi:hypothetical protein